MQSLLNYWQLVCLRCPPYQLKYSKSLLVCFVLLLAGIQLLSQVVALKVVDLAYLCVVMMIVVGMRALPLWVFVKPNRRVQSLQAQFGADLIVLLPRLLAILFNHWQFSSWLVLLLINVSIIWRILVTAYIYRHALQTSVSLSYAYAIILLIGEVIMIELFAK